MKHRAFTLIELLIVVAIIAILAAIAVPNFLEAQVRSKVSRVKADMRSLATAVEAYAVDHNAYPVEHDPNEQLITVGPGTGNRCGDGAPGTTAWLPCEFANITLVRCTTPIAYITSIQATADPFVNPQESFYAGFPNDPIPFPYMFYVNFETRAAWLQAQGNTAARRTEAYGFESLGPDNDDDGITNIFFQPVLTPALIDQFVNYVYDPTNGTISSGDITRFGGEIPGQMQATLSSVK